MMEISRWGLEKVQKQICSECVTSDVTGVVKCKIGVSPVNPIYCVYGRRNVYGHPVYTVLTGNLSHTRPL